MMEKLAMLNADTVSRFKDMENGIKKSIADLSLRIGYKDAAFLAAFGAIQVK